MIILDATTKSLEVKLAGAASTTELPVVASYVDINQSTVAMTAASENDAITTGGTAVTVVAAPGAVTSRKLNYLSVFNVDTAAAVVTVQVNNNTTLRITWKATLAVGDSLVYVDGIGWKVTDINGQIKTGPTMVSLTSGITGILPPANGGTGVANSSNNLLTFTGNYSLGLTLTGNTSLTLPTSGTLVNSAVTSLSSLATVGTITSGIWNAGAVTSSGNISTTAGTLTITGSNSRTHTFGSTANASIPTLKLQAGRNATTFLGSSTTNSDVAFDMGSMVFDRESGTTSNSKWLLYLNNGTSLTNYLTVTSAGLLTVSGFGTHSFSAGGTGANVINVINTTAGTGNYASVNVVADSTPTLIMRKFSSTYITGSWDVQAGAIVGTDGAGGLSVGATHASGVIRFYSGGTTLRAQINANGTQTWAPYGAGAATFDASGNITSASDERMKDIQGYYGVGLNEILKIKPILYRYNMNSGLDIENIYAGFSAQNVMRYIPEAVGKNTLDFYSINPAVILASAILAIQELTTEVDELHSLLGNQKKNRDVGPILDEKRVIHSRKAS